MRLRGACIALIAIAPVFAQELYDPPLRPRLNAVYPPQLTKAERARRNALSYLTNVFGGPVSLTAQSVREDDSLLHFKGGLEIKTKSMILQADEVSFNKATGEFIPSGNVRVMPVAE